MLNHSPAKLFCEIIPDSRTIDYCRQNIDVRLSVPDTRSDSVHARVPAPAIPVVDLKAPKKLSLIHI